MTTPLYSPRAKVAALQHRPIQINSARLHQRPIIVTPLPAPLYPELLPQLSPKFALLPIQLTSKKKTPTKFPHDVFSSGKPSKNIKYTDAQATQRIFMNKSPLLSPRSKPVAAIPTFELLAGNTILRDMEKLKSECTKILESQLYEQSKANFLPEIKKKMNASEPHIQPKIVRLSRVTSAENHLQGKAGGSFPIPTPRVTINLTNEFYFGETKVAKQTPRKLQLFNSNRKLPVTDPLLTSRPDSKRSEDLNQTGHFSGDVISPRNVKLAPVSAPPKRDMVQRAIRERAAIILPPNNDEILLSTTRKPTVVYLRKYTKSKDKEIKRDPVLNVTFGTNQPENIAK